MFASGIHDSMFVALFSFLKADGKEKELCTNSIDNFIVYHCRTKLSNAVFYAPLNDLLVLTSTL